MFNIDSRSVTFNLIMINILVFLVAQMKLEFMYSHLALFYPANPMFMPLQLISHMFMHAPLGSKLGLFHILFNMFGLFSLGLPLEHQWGPKKFLFFYLFTGLGAAALHIISLAAIIHSATGTFTPTYEMLSEAPAAASAYFTNTVGASGAIFGIFAAFAMLFPDAEMMVMFIPVPIKAKYLMIGYGLVELYFGLAMYDGDNVAHFAHLGGALFGFILVKLWSRNRFQKY